MGSTSGPELAQPAPIKVVTAAAIPISFADDPMSNLPDVLSSRMRVERQPNMSVT